MTSSDRRPVVVVDRLWTVPNLFTLLRLCCVPLFLFLLFGRDDRVSAALVLGGLGATDWVDGWLARTLKQSSEFGKVFDPTADRILFIVSAVAIIADRAAPVWFMLLVLVREFVVGAAMALATVLYKMQRFDVTWWGKTATFLLMFAVPGFMLGHSDIGTSEFFEWSGWVLGLPGLALSYYTAVAYIPMIRAAVAAG